MRSPISQRKKETIAGGERKENFSSYLPPHNSFAFLQAGHFSPIRQGTQYFFLLCGGKREQFSTRDCTDLQT